MMEGIWIICVKSHYLENGEEITKGRMFKSYARWSQACAPNYRRATIDEVENRDWNKGNWFNLKNV